MTVLRQIGRMTEAEFTDRIVDLAHTYGWKVAHFRPARTAKGWRTPVAYDGKGWPDLVLVHPAYGVLFREVKLDGAKLRPEQAEWLDALDDAREDVGVWRPADWQWIVEILSGGRAAA